MKANPGADAEQAAPLKLLMIGMGWFPNQIGGLDRYFTSLFQALGALREVQRTALVVGPASNATGVHVAARHDLSLMRRLLALVRKARSLDVDVIDAHFALYALLPLLVTPLRRVPLLVHFQGPWADESSDSMLRTLVKRRIEHAVYRRAARCIVLTGAFKRVLVERYGVSPWKVTIDPPGVDLQHFTEGDRAQARSTFGLPEDALVVSCVRRLVPRMGIDVLLEAWALLTPTLQRPAVLLIAGDGSLAQHLGEHAGHLGISDSVRFLGHVPDDALPNVYRAADVNVVPSLAHEGFGLVVLEAAACGTPSVVTRVGGLPEAIRRLDPSLVVDHSDPEALARRLLGPMPSRADTADFAATHDWLGVAERERDHLRNIVEPVSRRRLRVVYLDHVARMSGGEIALLRLLPHLHNVEAHVILGEDGPLVDALVVQGISVEVLPMPERARDTRKDNIRFGGVRARALFGTAVYTFRIARRLQALKPDLVHTNSLKSGVYGSIAARLVGIPVVWHVRDRLADDYLPVTANRLVQTLIRRLAAAVIANSRATLATVERPSRSTVVYSVVPEILDSTERSRPGPANAAPVFGLIGRIAPWKGQDVFIEAFARAFPLGEQRAALIGAPMFGNAESRFADGLEDLARSLGVAERVDFRGFRHDIVEELGRLDVLVHASRTPEPFGQVILEGMAAGVPVVASAEGGPLELIQDGHTGILYPPGDVEQLATILSELAADPSRRQRIGEAGQQRARDFLPGPIAAQVENLYRLTLTDQEDD